jgi:hypothetical protein
MCCFDTPQSEGEARSHSLSKCSMRRRRSFSSIIDITRRTPCTAVHPRVPQGAEAGRHDLHLTHDAASVVRTRQAGKAGPLFYLPLTRDETTVFTRFPSKLPRPSLEPPGAELERSFGNACFLGIKCRVYALKIGRCTGSGASFAPTFEVLSA